MNVITPDQSVEAREGLQLSQAMVARETGVSRPYISQFEHSKRILEDGWLEKLHDFYVSRGWEFNDDVDDESMEARLKSSKNALKIADGFVVCDSIGEADVEDLLEEYYANSVEIQKLEKTELRRSIFGGLSEEEKLRSSLRPLILMARQYRIKQMLHGQYVPHEHDIDASDDDTLVVAGDYIAALIDVATAGNRPTGE